MLLPKSSLGARRYSAPQHPAPRRISLSRGVLSRLRAVETWNASTQDSIGVAIAGIGPKNEQLLRSQGLQTVEDLERVHFELHRADLDRTRLYLQDVVGIRNKAAIRNILSFLEADGSLGPGASAADDMAAFEPAIMTILSNYAGLSLDRLQNMLLASSSEPRYNGGREALAGFLDQLVAEGKVMEENGLFKYRSMGPRAGSPSRTRSPSPSRTLPREQRLQAEPAPPPRSQQTGSRAARWGGSSDEDDEEEEEEEAAAADQELALHESQVLDLLSRQASGLSLDQLHDRMAGAERGPRFRQGVARLQLLLNAMEEQGTVSRQGSSYRFRRRTPQASRAEQPPSASASASASWEAPNSNSSSSSSSPASSSRSSGLSLAQKRGYEAQVLELLAQYPGLPLERLHNMMRLAPGNPRYEAQPEELEQLLSSLVGQGALANDNGVYKLLPRSPAPGPLSASALRSGGAAPRASAPAASPPPDIGSFEPALLDLLQNYAGLTAERLHSLMASSPKAAGYSGSVAQLSGLLAQLVAQGKVTQDGPLYRYRSGLRTPSPSASRGTPQGGRRPASPPPARTPSASRSSAAATAPPAPVAVHEPVILELLQNYAGLSLERLDKLLASSPRAAGYVSNTPQLAGLLTSLAARGRVTLEGGLYRYRSTGKTPQPRRKSVPRPSPNSPEALSASFSALLDKARRSMSPGAPASTSPTAATAKATSPAPGSDWAPFEGTLMTLVGNYGALPLERLHEMLRASMVWPRFSKTPAELRSHLDGLVAAGRLAYEAGLYRKAGTPSPTRPGTPLAAALPGAVFEGRVLAALASYPGLSLDRLNNMLRTSDATPKYDLSPDQLATLMGNLQGQGKVVQSSLDLPPAAPAAAPGPPAPPRTLQAPDGDILNTLGFATAEGWKGFTPAVEVLNGRLAMVGVASSVLRELRSDAGSLEQLGLQGLPATDLAGSLLTGLVGLCVLGTAIQGVRYFTGNMRDTEVERYSRFLRLQPQDLPDADRFFTPELKYARKAELTNGRAAMIGFAIGIVMEAVTGRGLLGQIVLYLKISGLLSETSGF